MQKIIDELRTHETTIQQELDAVNRQAATLEEKLSQVRIAIDALGGKSRQQVKVSQKAIGKRTLSLDDVKNMVVSLIRENGNMPRDRLYNLLEIRVVESGKPKFGLRAKFAKILAASPTPETS